MKKFLLIIVSIMSIWSLNAQKPSSNSQRMNKGGGGLPLSAITQDYCELTATNYNNSSLDFINGVTIGSVVNLESGVIDNTTGYAFYSTPIFRIQKGTDNLLTVQNGSLGENYVKAWIDYDNDGVFEDSETLGDAVYYESGSTWNTIPFNVADEIEASTSRLRISIFFNEEDSIPCGSKLYGETEDYLIVINDNPLGYCMPSSVNLSFEGDYCSASSGYVDGLFGGFSPEYAFINENSMYGKQGEDTEIELTFGEFSIEYATVYIDYNQNNSFEEEEMVLDAQSINPFDSFDLSFTVPLTAPIGITRMRVVCSDDPEDEPCDALLYGHVVDYNFLVHPALGAYGTCYGENMSGPQDGDYLQSYSFGMIDFSNEEIANRPYYYNFIDEGEFTYVVKGESYDLSMQIGSIPDDYYSMWLDYNGNYSLEDEERVFQSIGIDPDEFLTASIEIPTNAVDGATILRFQCVYDIVDAPLCDDQDYGDMHDYMVIFTGSPTDYCAAVFEYGNSEGDFINAVSLGDIDISDIGEDFAAYYHDYTDLNTTIEIDEAYTLIVQAGDYGSDTYTAWIDFNQDNIYSEDEKIGEEVGTTAFENFNFDFTVPDDAILGNTRMRIVCSDEGDVLSPCLDASYGEYLEFSITIESAELSAQSITFPSIDDVMEDVGTINLNATATSGLGVVFTVISGPATVVGNVVTVTGAGPIEIEVNQAGDDEYSAAATQSQSFCSTPLQPIVGSDQGDGSVLLTSSSNSNNQWYMNGGAIGGATNQTYTATEPGLYSVIVDADGCVSEASVIYNYEDSTLETQTITFPAIGDVLENIGSFTLNATATSGLSVTYTVLSGPASIAGNTISITGAGPIQLEASQPGNDEYNAATSITHDFCSNPLQPVITAEPMGNEVELTSSSVSDNQWLLDGSEIAGAEAMTYDAAENGNYTVYVDVDGCVSEVSDAISVIDLAVEESVVFNELFTYPNPLKDQLTIETPTLNQGYFYIYSMTGELVLEGELNGTNNKTTIQVSNLNAGIYNLNVKSGDKIFNMSIIKM